MDSMRKKVGLTTVHDIEGRPVYSGTYGLQQALDLKGCDIRKFKKRGIKGYFKGLIKLIEMKAGMKPIFIECPDGLNAVQFILTSQISVHCVDRAQQIFIDIFSIARMNWAIRDRRSVA